MYGIPTERNYILLILSIRDMVERFFEKSFGRNSAFPPQDHHIPHKIHRWHRILNFE